jgi:hypothetical protein
MSDIKLRQVLSVLWPTTKFVVHDLDTGLHTDTLQASDNDEADYAYQTQTVVDKAVRDIYIPTPNTDGVLHVNVSRYKADGSIVEQEGKR